jgi:hypothetical protein
MSRDTIRDRKEVTEKLMPRMTKGLGGKSAAGIRGTKGGRMPTRNAPRSQRAIKAAGVGPMIPAGSGKRPQMR